MNDGNEVSLHRILVAFDAATLSCNVFDAVAALAARLQAELRGLFIEDVDLLRSAELPFVRQFSLTSASGDEFNTESIERELKVMAAQARRALEDAAHRTKIRYSFDVVRGQLVAEVGAASEATDLVVLLSSCRPLTRYMHMDAPGRAAALELGRSVLLLEAGAELPQELAVVFDGRAASIRALRLAARLAGVINGKLRVLALVDQGINQAELEARARSAFDPHELPVRFQPVTSDDASAVAAKLRQKEPSLLVINADSPLLERRGATALLSGPALVVR